MKRLPTKEIPEEQKLLLKLLEFCMEEYEEVGPSETFSVEDYVQMTWMRGRIIGLTDEQITNDLMFVDLMEGEEGEEETNDN